MNPSRTNRSTRLDSKDRHLRLMGESRKIDDGSFRYNRCCEFFPSLLMCANGGLEPRGKACSDSGTAVGAIARQVIDNAHLQRTFFHRPGKNDPGFYF